VSKQLTDILAKAERERLFGNITLQYRSGQLELIRIETTLKPQERNTYDLPNDSTK
jgi:hypothetical protein